MAIAGDGTFGEGVLYESLNLAASKECPILYIIEDNKTGEYRLSHHVDLKSGYYNGKKILDI